MEPSVPAQADGSSTLRSSPANPEHDVFVSGTDTVISASGVVQCQSPGLVFKLLNTRSTLANQTEDEDEKRFWIWTAKDGTAEKPSSAVAKGTEPSIFEPSRGEEYLIASKCEGNIKLDLNVGLYEFEDELEGGKGSENEEGGKMLISGGSIEVGVQMLEEETRGNAAGSAKRERCSREKKGKGKLVEPHKPLDGAELVILDEEPSSYGHGSLKRCRASRDEKEKGKLVMDDLPGIGIHVIELDSEPESENSVQSTVHERHGNTRREKYMQRFREAAAQHALKYAVFNENHLSLGAKNEGTSSIKSKPSNVNWVPRKSQDHHRSKSFVPSLLELSMKILLENADAITTLEGVPDEMKHRLSQLLCDSRRMNTHFFHLLVRGSPTEVRLRDCSWLTDDQFTKSFESCDTKHLMVLQLDQCGRCLPDYVLQASLARSPKCLPALAILSLTGAFHLSDVGISSLISSAPALRSINLSQCSLLTSKSIKILADSLDYLKELYIDGCQNIDAMLILSPLQKLKHLQVLSLAGIQTVCDGFIREFTTACGHNMKELVLTDCVELTDTSLKTIAETCSGLCRLDLVNLCKLTDSAVGYLANGCRAIQTLKLGRNLFSEKLIEILIGSVSDEAIAAYLENSGESLRELSLNNLTKVGHKTAMSLARCLKKLINLDVSWCRNLTEEDVGLIVDGCLSLRVLKVFGCTQITHVLVDGHSNPNVRILGLKLSSILENLKMPDTQLLKYSSLSVNIWS